MDINAITAFIEVARYQSFSLAADALFLTQPAISKRITALETELGIQLFNRINRTVTLTEAGCVLLPRVQNLRNEIEDIRQFASSLSGDIAGTLSMGTSHHIGLRRLPPSLQYFNQNYPNVHLDLHFVDSEQACLAVERGELEIAVVTLPSQLPDRVQAQLLWIDQLHIIAPPGHPFCHTDQTSLERLAYYPCVLPSPNTYTYQILRQALEPLHLRLNIHMNTNYLETLKMLVSAGFGWSLIPHTMLDDSVVVINTPLSLQRRLGIITHQKRNLSNAAKAMQDTLNSFSEHPE